MRTRRFVHAVILAVALSVTALGSASAEGCGGKGKRACEVPETPYVAVLPAVTMVGVVGLYLLQRRRASQMAEDDASA